MAKTIQDLRKEAGYSSAKDFAAALGIPQSTYARYENQPDGIPLKQAWAIADFLGCSIDMVVGREPVSVDDMRGDMQKFFDELSPQGQALFLEFRDFISLKEAATAKQRQEMEDRQYESYARYYERMFMQQAENDAAFGDMAVFGFQDVRSAFERFLVDRAAAKRKIDIELHLEGFEEELRQPDDLYDYDEDDNVIGVSTVFLPEQDIQESLEEERERMEAEHAKKDEEVIRKIMAAYDRLRGEGDPDVSYFAIGF